MIVDDTDSKTETNANSKEIEFSNLKVGSSVSITHINGTIVEGLIVEMGKSSLSVKSELGGLTVVFKREEIAVIVERNSSDYSKRQDSALLDAGKRETQHPIFAGDRRNGRIVSYVPGFRGSLVDDNGLSFGFSHRNMEETLAAAMDESYTAGVSAPVTFQPAVYTDPKGSMKPTATDIRAKIPIDEITSLLRTAKEFDDRIPEDDKRYVFDVLSRFCGINSSPKHLSQVTIQLKEAGIDYKSYGFQKAKAFLEEFSFVRVIDESGGSAGAVSVLVLPYDTKSIDFDDVKEKVKSMRAPLEDLEAFTTNFDPPVDLVGLPDTVSSALENSGYSTIAEVERDVTNDPTCLLRQEDFNQDAAELVSEKIMLYKMIKSLLKVTQFTEIDALGYLAADVVPEPKYDHESGTVFVPGIIESKVNGDTDSCILNCKSADSLLDISEKETENRINGRVLSFKHKALRGQVLGDDGHTYRISNRFLSEDLLVYLSGGTAKDNRFVRVAFEPKNFIKQSGELDYVAYDVVPADILEIDAESCADKALDALLHKNYKAAEVLFEYAVNHGCHERVSAQLNLYLTICHEQDSITIKNIKIFDKYMPMILSSHRDGLLVLYDRALAGAKSNYEKLGILARIIDANILFGNYEEAIRSCDEWVSESISAKNKVKTAERAREISLRRAEALFSLGRIAEAKDISNSYLALNPENAIARAISDNTYVAVALPYTGGNLPSLAGSEHDLESILDKHVKKVNMSPSKAADLGREFLLKKDYESAEPLLLHSISHGMAKSVVGDYVTLCLQQEGKENDALAVVSRFSSCMQREKVRNLLIRIYEKLRDYESLINLYEEAYCNESLDRKKSHYLEKIIECHIKMSNYSAGLKGCFRWEAFYKHKKYGHSADILQRAFQHVELKKAICLYFLGRTDEASEIARRRISQNPTNEIANAILDGTLAQVRMSSSGDNFEPDGPFEFSNFDDETFDDFDGPQTIQNGFVNNLIRSFDISQIQKKHVENNKYIGSFEDAKDDVSKILNGLDDVGPKTRYEHRLAACQIIRQTLSRCSAESENDPPWKEAYLTRTAARAMLYWGDGHIQIGQQDSSRMAYLFALSNLSPKGKKPSGRYYRDNHWFNACDNYLNSFFLGGSLSSYISKREKTSDLNTIVSIFSNRELPSAVVPSFVVGLMDLAEALSSNPSERSEIEDALVKRNPDLCCMVSNQLSIILEDEALSVTDAESLGSSLDRARIWRKRKIERLRTLLTPLSTMKNSEGFINDALAFVKEMNWSLICSETDSNRIEAIAQVLGRLVYYSENFDFEFRADILKDSLARIDDLLRNVKEAPTELSYNYLMPILEGFAGQLVSAQSELFEEHQPKLSWELAVQPHQAGEGIYRIQLLVSNEEGCQAASSIIVEDFEEEEKGEVISVVDCSKIGFLFGGYRLEIIMLVNVSPDVESVGSFTLPLRFTYESSDSANAAPTTKEEQVSLPVVILDEEFEPFENPYAAYGGGSPITNENDEMFFGRQAERQKLISMVRQGDRMNYGCAIAMYGQTRTGKSSLLGQVKSSILRAYSDQIVLCDLGNIGSIQADDNDPDRFLAEFLYQILVECADSIKDNELISNFVDFEEIDPPLEILDNPSHAAPLFHRCMKRLDKALRQADAIVLLIVDEFTYLHSLIREGKVTKNFMRLWKAMLQDYCIFAMVVGQDDMPEFMSEYPNEFACMDTIKLTYLEEQPAKELIHVPLERSSGKTEVFKDEAIDMIHQLTAGSAFLTMKFCSKLVDYLNENRIHVVTEGIVRAFLRDKALGQNSFLEEKDFEPQLKERGHPEYDEITKQILCSIAGSGLMAVLLKQVECENVSPEKIEGLLERLVDRNVLEKRGGRYSIRVLLLTLWLAVAMEDE